MKLLTNGLKWFTAVAVAVAGIGLGGGSLIAPDPAFAKFEIDKLTIGGDLRVRPEFRRGSNFGSTERSDQFVQQRTRLRLNYDISPDVAWFLELQDARNFGLGDGGGDTNNIGGPNNNPNDIHGEALGVRQGYVAIKNAGLRGLSLKIGRQKVIFGDHRLLGSFDWNNVGFSQDGIRADYSTPMASHVLGWFRLADLDCGAIDSGGCGSPSNASADSDLVVFYNTFKNLLPGGTIEPYYFFLFDNRPAVTGATTKDGRIAPSQQRHFLGTRINGKAMNKMIDYTGEIVWQTGNQRDDAGAKQQINAWAAAVKGGVTFKDVMWSPRLGFEVDYASGSGGDAEDSGGRHTFEGLLPTNHLHYGYMDRMGWKNMVDYSPQLLVRPDKASSLKVNLHILRLASSKDNWYGAGQSPIATTRAGNQAASLGKEIDIVYTRKLKEGKVGLQIGYGHFFPGEYHARSQEGTQGGTGVGNTSQDWGYVQVTTKF